MRAGVEMKITVEGGADLLYMMLKRTDSEFGESYVMTVDGKAYQDTFMMPKGNGVLVLHV